MMPRVDLNSAAPEFTLDDYRGKTFSLSDYKGKRHVLLALNRGFI